MPDIFLSYSREDQPVARRFAEGLEREGFSVWWDQTLQPGEAFDQVTEKALAEARAVVVLWSKISVDSRWVRAEATQAHAMNRLVPVMIQACKRPILFELTQTADLAGWDGDTGNPAWRSLVAGIRRMTGGASASSSAPIASAVPASRPAVRHRSWPIAAVITGLVIVAAVGAGYYLRKTGNSASPVPAPAQVSTAPSIAVLPFANLTSDPEQEYFSDGLTEELLNELAQIQGLRVIGRTSSFAFKGSKEGLRRISEVLGVNHILEGSVRKSGDRLRIYAQLTNPADGSNLWSKVYERKLDDIFAIQEEIAATVAGALRVALAGGEQQAGGTRNFAAYDALLAGRAGLNSNSIDLSGTQSHFEKAVELDPNYLMAWVWLMDTYTRGLFSPEQREDSRASQARALGKVVSVAPDSVFATVARSYRALVQGNLLDSDRLLSASVDAPAGLGLRARLRYGQFLLAVGRSRDAVATLKQALAADPLDVFARLQLILAYEISGDVQLAAEARDVLLKLPGGDSPSVRAQQLTAAMARGDNAEVVRLVAQAAPSESPLLDVLKKHGDNPSAALPEIRRLLRDERYNQQPILVTNIAGWAGYLGDTELALDALRRAQDMGLSFETWAWTLWRTVLRDVRQSTGFKSLIRDLKLDAYWAQHRQLGRFLQAPGQRRLRVPVSMPDIDTAPPPPRVRLCLGVTGHRDTNPDFIANRGRIEKVLTGLLAGIDAAVAQARAQDPAIAQTHLYSLLADGTDQIAAAAALARQWELVAPLPFGLALNIAINAHPQTPEDAEALLESGDFARVSDPSVRDAARRMMQLAQPARLFELADRDESLGRLYLAHLRQPADRHLSAVFPPRLRCASRSPAA